MSSYSGYILANHIGSRVTSQQIEVRQPIVAKGPRFLYIDHAYGVSRWSEYSLHAPAPLADEPSDGRSEYQYQVFVVRGSGKVIVLAARRRIVDYVLVHILDRTISPSLRKVSIFVDKLIRFCTTNDSEFLITSLHGRFAGASKNIKSISLYGDDVTNSNVYSDNGRFFNFHSSGLGRRLFDGLPRLKSNEEGEIVRVSHDGFINLNLTTRRQALELMRVVEFIFSNRWVEDWVPKMDGENNDT